METATVGQKFRMVWLHCQRSIECRFSQLEVAELEMSEPLVDERLEVVRLERKRPFAACDGRVISLEHHFRDAAIAIGFGVVGL